MKPDVKIDFPLICTGMAIQYRFTRASSAFSAWLHLAAVCRRADSEAALQQGGSRAGRPVQNQDADLCLQLPFVVVDQDKANSNFCWKN